MQEIRNSEVYQEVLKKLSKLKVNKNKDKPYILLDGILATSHNLFINAAIGLAVHEVHGYNLAFLTSGSLLTQDIAEAVGADAINISLYNSKRYPLRKLKYLFDKIEYRNIEKNDILSMNVQNVHIGDLIYDSLIRNYSENYTHSHFKTEQIKGLVEQSIYNVHAFLELSRYVKINMLTLSHKYYTTFGVFARCATKMGVDFISKNRSHLNLISNYDDHLMNDYYIDKNIKAKINKMPLSAADSYIHERFNGNLEQHDVKYAFSSKKEYAYNEIQHAFNLDSKLPIGVIMPHAFSDAPHSDSFMIYNDYYVWLVETLKLIESIDHVQWLIKPHPSSEIYQEEGVVSRMVENLEHVSIVPKDIRTTSILKIADAVVTVRGTAGLEAVLFDAQPILAGASYYMDLGFTKNCKTVEEYKKTLASIKKKTPIDESVKNLVKKVIYWRNESYFFYSGIFGPERVPGLSDEEVLKHELSNYQHVNSFLNLSDYKSDKYYKKLLAFFSEGKKTLCALDFLEHDKSQIV